MKHVLGVLTIPFLAWTYCTLHPAYAMTDAQRKEFRRIMHLPMKSLTAEANKALEEEYPGEDWQAYHFPVYVYSNESVETAYKIAAKMPSLLSKIRCACLCRLKGHKSLLYCFYKAGRSDGEFDSHAAGCNVCYRQAMMGFLWKRVGLTEEEIVQGMEEYASS